MNRNVSRGMARSSSGEMNQDGTVFHAGSPDASLSAVELNGR
jgi:hypothetical protein